MIYGFGDFRLDTGRRELRGPSGPVALEPRCLELLSYLLRERARAVSKDDIHAQVWADVVVTDASLSTAIRQIRQAVGDDGTRQGVIRTVRGHGFRFVARVEELTDALAAPGREGAPRPGKPTVAVLPFRLLGGDPVQMAIAEAIPAELIATLSRLHWISVIARGSSFRFRGGTADMRDTADSLGARFVVSGLVELHPGGVAIFAQLTDTRSATVIWSDRVAGTLSEIYELRARVARDVTIALDLRLPLHEADRLIHEPSESIDAWGHYHLGVRHIYRYNREDNARAAAHFRTAIEMDPGFARAHAGLSYTEFQNAFQHFGADPAAHRSGALALAEDAMRFDPLDPFCNLIYGRAKWLAGDAEDGLVWVDRAVELNPNYAFGHYNNATLNTVLCNTAVADRNVGAALELSPLDPHLQSMYGTRALACFVADDLDSAVRYADRATRSPNPHLYVHMIAAAVYARSGANDKAQTCVDAIHAKEVPFGKAEFLTHFNLRDSGRLAQLTKTLDSLGL